MTTDVNIHITVELSYGMQQLVKELISAIEGAQYTEDEDSEDNDD